MPSLRRIVSAPTSRSSPYTHTCTSSPPSSSLSTRAGSRGPRRPSGSETSERRVLADLDIWRIEASQREVRGLAPSDLLRSPSPASSEEDEVDQEERDPTQAASAAAATVAPAPTEDEDEEEVLVPLSHAAPGSGSSAFEDATPLRFDFALGDIGTSEPLETLSPLTPFASLSVSSQGRSAFRRTASMSSTLSDVSFSSDSSPFSTPSLTPANFGFGFSDIVTCPVADDDSDDEVPGAPLAMLPRPSVPSMGRRSASLSWIEDELFTNDRFESVSPVDRSSPFSSSWTTDEDDFFFH